jgi:hypothetical protein
MADLKSSIHAKKSKYVVIKHLELNYLRVRRKWVCIANKLLLPIWERPHFHVFLPIEHKGQHWTHLTFSGKDKEIIISKSDFETRNMTHFYWQIIPKSRKTIIISNQLTESKFLRIKSSSFRSAFGLWQRRTSCRLRQGLLWCIFIRMQTWNN